MDIESRQNPVAQTAFHIVAQLPPALSALVEKNGWHSKIYQIAELTVSQQLSDIVQALQSTNGDVDAVLETLRNKPNNNTNSMLEEEKPFSSKKK